jgi:hypothetical protein
VTNIYISATKDCAGTVEVLVVNQTGTGATFKVALGPVAYIKGPFHLADGASVQIDFPNASGALSYGFLQTPVLDNGLTAIVHGGGQLTAPINCATTTTTTIPATTTTIPTTTTTIPTTTTTVDTPSTTIPRVTTTVHVNKPPLPPTGFNGSAVAGMGSVVLFVGCVLAIIKRKVTTDG